MNDISSDDIFLLKQRLAEQEALIHALQEKLSNREREIDHLQAQLDKLRRAGVEPVVSTPIPTTAARCSTQSSASTVFSAASIDSM
nr:hypothetical protein [Escherichia coli]